MHGISKTGKVKGAYHTDGGVDILLHPSGRMPNVEKDEWIICGSAMKSPQRHEFKNKTAAEILEKIYSLHGCEHNPSQASDTDFVVCKLVVNDKVKRSIAGTVKEIINTLQLEKQCKVTSDCACPHENKNDVNFSFALGGEFPKVSPEDFEKIKIAFAHAVEGLLAEEKIKLFELTAQLESKQAESLILREMESKMEYGKERTQISDKRNKLWFEIERLRPIILHQENVVQAVHNGGDLASFTDKKNLEHKNIPQFTRINSEMIAFDEETILTDPQPVYIPKINEEVFRQKGYVFDALRIAPDNYLVAVNEYKETVSDSAMSYRSTGATDNRSATDAEQGYVILTLDQLVLTNDYYFKKAKAISQKEADDKSARNEAYYDKLSVEKRAAHLNQKNFYNALPASVKKKITQQAYEALTLEEKEKLYKPYKRYGAKRLTSELKENYMWRSYHQMYERFINPEATHPKEGIANPETFDYWRSFRDMMEWKIKDIEIQREDLSQARQTALETSFGESNTSDVLKEKWGILVKRQNGSKIKPAETEQIEKGWEKINKTFGTILHHARQDSLKISHTGNKYVFASKAAGMFLPKMKTIAVSAKFGNEQFENTFAHEVGHYIDNSVGELSGRRYASDDYEGTAGKIGFALRKNMNAPSDSKYINATKECFARALEQYFAFSNFGEDATLVFSYHPLESVRTYHSEENYVSKEKFNSIVKPLVEQFLKENELFFQYDLPEISEPMKTKTGKTALDQSLSEGEEQFNQNMAHREAFEKFISPLFKERFGTDFDSRYLGMYSGEKKEFVKQKQAEFESSFDSEGNATVPDTFEEFLKIEMKDNKLVPTKEPARTEWIDSKRAQYDFIKNRKEIPEEVIPETKSTTPHTDFLREQGQTPEEYAALMQKNIRDEIEKGGNPKKTGVSWGEYMRTVEENPNLLTGFILFNLTLPAKQREYFSAFDEQFTPEVFWDKINENLYNLIPSELKQIKPIKPLHFTADPEDKNLANIIKPFAGTDDLRIRMMGVYFDDHGITATDAHQLIHIAKKPKKHGIYCMTKKCWDAVTADDNIPEEKAEKNLQKEKYPDYARIIPQNGSVLRINCESLRQFLIPIIEARITSRVIKTVVVSFGEGDEKQFFGFNSQFLLNATEAMLKLGHSEIDIMYSTPVRGILMAPIGKAEEASNLTCDFVLVMPVLLGGAGDYGRFDKPEQFYFNMNTECIDQAGQDSVCLNRNTIKENELENLKKEVAELKKEKTKPAPAPDTTREAEEVLQNFIDLLKKGSGIKEWEIRYIAKSRMGMKKSLRGETKTWAEAKTKEEAIEQIKNDPEMNFGELISAKESKECGGEMGTGGEMTGKQVHPKNVPELIGTATWFPKQEQYHVKFPDGGDSLFNEEDLVLVK